MSDFEKLSRFRTEIDAIDEEILQLILRRAERARAIGELKKGADQSFYAPDRERDIFSRLAQKLDPNLPAVRMESIFREIISACREVEKRLAIGFWGPQGSYSEIATIKCFGEGVDRLAKGSIDEVFSSVERRECEYGIVPVENSLAGVVPETLDRFSGSNLKVCSEVFVPIRHAIGSQTTSLPSIERLYVGPQPAAQCRKWIKQELPQVEIHEVVPTSMAISKALEESNSAAVGHVDSLKAAGLTVLAQDIQDQVGNTTRFWVVGYNQPRPSGNDKTSLVFSVRDTPGALYAALGTFVESGVNLVMIESRPTLKARFEYLFFVDCQGHLEDENVKEALSRLRKEVHELTLLGSYPAWNSG